jgi:hypothetical protein
MAEGSARICCLRTARGQEVVGHQTRLHFRMKGGGQFCARSLDYLRVDWGDPFSAAGDDRHSRVE